MYRALIVIVFICLIGPLGGCGGGGSGGGSDNSVDDGVDVDVGGDDNGGSDDVDSGVDEGGDQAKAISGMVSAAAGMMADTDTNSYDTPYVYNDDLESAQPISNPVLLGGYANSPYSGPAGPSYEFGDIADFFKVDLIAGQTITLHIADPASGDLDLYLYRDDGSVDIAQPDDSSIGVEKTEALTVAESGSYFVLVYVYYDDNLPSSYSNYNLVIGQDVAPRSAMLRLSDEFVPGEFVVKFKDAQKQSAAMKALGLQARTGGANEVQLMHLGDTAVQRQAVLQHLGVNLRKSRMPLGGAPFLDAQKQAKLDTLLVVKALRKRKDVLYAEPNYIRRATAVPLDAEYGKQWHYRMINLPSAWEVSAGSGEVTVAVVDTGVLLNHPDLIGQFSADGGYDFISSHQNSGDAEPGIDANPNDVGDAPDYSSSSSFHGSHVAGTIAGRTDFAAASIGVAGIAPNAKIMPLRVLGKEGGTAYDIVQALRYAAGLPNDSGRVPAKIADVINLSLGGGGYSQAEQALFDQLRALGIVVVAAAGNDATSALSYPASYNNVISVSAVDTNGNLAPYSNYGSRIDVAAPGGAAACC